MTIQKTAQKYLDMFEVKTRQNGEKFICVKDSISNLPDFYDKHPLNSLIKACHGDLLPDDYVYQYIVESLDLMANMEAIDEITIEPDIYNHELLKWVASHANRVELCNDVLTESFETENTNGTIDFMSIISYAQQREKEEVFKIVREHVENTFQVESEFTIKKLRGQK